MNNNTNKEILAYLAGCMDSDGYFTINKSSYHKRVRKDAHNNVYSERIGLKQVTPDIPMLIKSTFGGYLSIQKGQTENSKPLFSIQATNLIAVDICKSLLPYLRVKKKQAELLLELRESKKPMYLKLSYWYEKEYPNWRLSNQLITVEEAAKIIGYKNNLTVYQAIRNRTLLAIKGNHHNGRKIMIPQHFVEKLANHAKKSKDGYARNQPEELVQWRERLYKAVSECNKIGVNGTDIFFKKGVFKQKI